MILKDKDLYHSKKSKDIYTLNLDYNGLWYLSMRTDKGYHKTLSCSVTDMKYLLKEHYISDSDVKENRINDTVR